MFFFIMSEILPRVSYIQYKKFGTIFADVRNMINHKMIIQSTAWSALREAFKMVNPSGKRTNIAAAAIWIVCNRYELQPMHYEENEFLYQLTEGKCTNNASRFSTALKPARITKGKRELNYNWNEWADRDKKLYSQCELVSAFLSGQYPDLLTKQN